jgi:hypothetical protein
MTTDDIFRLAVLIFMIATQVNFELLRRIIREKQ